MTGDSYREGGGELNSNLGDLTYLPLVVLTVTLDYFF